jgi:hypothetical protein
MDLSDGNIVHQHTSRIESVRNTPTAMKSTLPQSIKNGHHIISDCPKCGEKMGDGERKATLFPSFIDKIVI